MYITHDSIDEIECSECHEVVPYYEIKDKKCEYCYEEKEENV